MKCRREIKQTLFTALLVGCLLAQQVPLVAQASKPDDNYAQEVFSLLENPQADVITIQEDVEVKVNGRYFCYVKGGEDREKVLDLNGHTVSLDGLYNFANLLLTDSVGGGKLILTSTLYNQGGSLTISGINVVRTKDAVGGAAICNYWPGMFYLDSGTVDATQVVRMKVENGGRRLVPNGMTARSP